MSQNLQVQIKPNFYALAIKMGYDIENGNINEAHVLHQQGIETEDTLLNPGERFKIDAEESDAYIIRNGNDYLPLCNIEFESFTEEFNSQDDVIELGSGEYLFHEDGITLEFISYLIDEDDESYN